jgi:uncharacterized protein (DUF488 family)
MNELFTIGYADFSISEFLFILKKNKINVVVDVRSAPYSSFKPDFNRERLKLLLNEHKLHYLFLGEYCGARTEDSKCYINNKVDYGLLSKSHNFQLGLRRIKNGIQKYRIALMCAENDPITCHRNILICKNLKSPQLEIKHIIAPDLTELNEKTEERLLNLFYNQQNELFSNRDDLIEEAYYIQGKLIAYTKKDKVVVRNE